MHIDIHAYIHIDTYTNMHMHIHIHIYIQICEYVYIQHKYIYMSIFLYIWHIYISTFTQHIYIHCMYVHMDSLESDYYCTKSYFNVSVSEPSTLYKTVRNMANIDRPSFIAELSSVSEFSSVEKAGLFCDLLCTVLDKHAPPSLWKAITHNSTPWFESIRDELFIAKRERCQAERKWRNTKLTIFKDLYRQAKLKVSKLVHTAKCKFYTERIALASSSKELHQIVNTLSNRHLPKILPTIYPSSDLLSTSIKHLNNRVVKHRANIASEHVTSTLVTGTTAATFSSFDKVS